VHLSENLREPAWACDLDPRTLCFSVDVEWAHLVVLKDLRGLFDEAGIAATFFVTREGVVTPGHERALHPNFRRNGDSYRALLASGEASSDPPTDSEIHRFVLERTLGFAPEAKGLRTHKLYCESTLLPLYSLLGLEYDCSYDMPLVAGLRPFWKSFYHEPERLLAARNRGRGVRTLLLELLDHVVARQMPIARLDQINACWRRMPKARMS
jgi:Polysaccharide deacetylase